MMSPPTDVLRFLPMYELGWLHLDDLVERGHARDEIKHLVRCRLI
ncbi:MAG: hypothetical protein ACYDH6_19475 [Acidimicrobiales bacterium]